VTVLAGKTVDDNCFKYCIADLNKKCTIETRVIVPPKMGQLASSISFSTLFTGFFKILTTRGTRRFSGVNIDEKTTHLFITRWKTSIDDLDGAGEHFIKRLNIYYKVVDITNLNEHNRWLIFQCTERGIDTEEETNA
jgi:hypothetical protein